MWLQGASSEPQPFSGGIVTFSAVSKINPELHRKEQKGTSSYSARNDQTNHKSTAESVDHQEARKKAQQVRVSKGRELSSLREKRTNRSPQEGTAQALP